MVAATAEISINTKTKVFYKLQVHRQPKQTAKHRGIRNKPKFDAQIGESLRAHLGRYKMNSFFL
jgi:hypothetical protein